MIDRAACAHLCPPDICMHGCRLCRTMRSAADDLSVALVPSSYELMCVFSRLYFDFFFITSSGSSPGDQLASVAFFHSAVSVLSVIPDVGHQIQQICLSFTLSKTVLLL